MHAHAPPLTPIVLFTDLPEVAADELAADIFGEALLPWELVAHQPGDVVGPFRLVEKLGVGAFGTVWRAEQSRPVKREVALKILKFGMDTLEVIGRFEQERQALALMDHPNIAKVLDAGATAEGRPYFVMELVRGLPLTHYCQEKALSLEQRLVLMREICQGVQHAHQKGIIHRDLKPSNILVTEVDGTPTPKIIDFGIAKATTEKLSEFTLLTRFDQLMGTPIYMSPEQVESSKDIDTRTDVYALGALLYELLAGCPPFDTRTLNASGYEEIRRIIREERPKPPSRRNGEIRRQNAGVRTGSEFRPASFEIRHSRDLDLITLRALEKDRSRRYQTATALGEDIQRFLDHEPILARAPGTFYLLQRWVSRHRTVSVAAVLVLLTLVGGLAATYQQKLAAQAQERQADAMLAMVLGVLTHSEDMRDISTPGVTTLIAQIADEAAKFPADNLRLMHLETAIGTAFISLANFGLADVSKAIVHLERAEAAAITAGAAADDLITIRLLLLRKLAANPATAERALSYARTLEAAYTEPSVVVRVLALKAAAQLNAKQFQEAVVTFEAMLQEIKTAQPPVPAAIVVQARQAYACALRVVGRRAEGLAAAEETVRLAEATPDITTTNLSLAIESLGQEYQKSKMWAEARQQSRRTFDLRLAQLGHQHPLTIKAEDNVILITELMGQPLESLALRRDQITLLAEDVGALDPSVLTRFSWLLAAYIKAGLRNEAEEFITITLAPHRTANGDISPKATGLLRRIFYFYRGRRDWARLESAGRTLLKALRQQEPAGLLTAAVQVELAQCLSEQGRHAEAAQEAETMIKVLEPRKAESKKIEKRWLPMLRKIIKTSASVAPPSL